MATAERTGGTIRQYALIGIVTLHLAMPAVLDNYPDRADPTVDGYIAVVDCGRMGSRYVLRLDGRNVPRRGGRLRTGAGRGTYRVRVRRPLDCRR